MAFKGIDHVVIRVKDIDTAIESYRNLGLELTRTLETPAIGKQAIFSLADGTFIELVAPLSPDSAVGRAIAMILAVAWRTSSATSSQSRGPSPGPVRGHTPWLSARNP